MLTKTVFEPPEVLPGSKGVQANTPIGKRRDPRLDFFRGLGMMIIFVAHVPYDHWALWIPARFGFSDATEMFVFLSGMASAIAFGRLFDRAGFIGVTARVAQRIWQIYWAHICLFLAVATLMAAAGLKPDGGTYINSLNLDRFFETPAMLLPHLLTLTYVPNYFDVLPMYMVILALMPLMLLAERLYRVLPFLLMGLLWAGAAFHILHLPAEPWSDRPWFFNPFGWQLVFFTGFFLMRGTLASPAFSKPLMALALAIVLITIPFAWYLVLDAVPFFKSAANALLPLTDKSTFGILRYVHFLSLAYIATHAMGADGHRLKGPGVHVMMKVGQQSLAVFITGMFTAQLLGLVLDQTDRSFLPTTAVNLTGFLILIATAYTVSWFKAAPWKAA